MSLGNVKFTKPKAVKTRHGEKYVRKWVIPIDQGINEGFWVFWKEHKTKMMGKGFVVYKDKKTKRWELQEWKDQLTEFPEYEIKKDIILESDLKPTPLRDESGLREWQIPASAQIAASVRKHGAAIDGSDTGTGKTYASIGAARELGMKVAVVCPKAVIDSWKRCITDHFKMEYEFVLNYEALKNNKHPQVKKVRIKGTTTDEFKWDLPKNTLIIYDESHRLKGKGTINSKIAKAAKKQGYKILCCSATNAINPMELDTVGYILGLHRSGNTYYKWIREHGCKQAMYGWEYNGSKYILRKLHKDIFLDRGIRLKKEDIPDFPESEIITEPYSLDNKSTEQINKIYADMAKEMEELEKRVKKDTQGMQLTKRLRNRQKIELLKAPLFIEMTEDLIAEGNSVVIMCNFSETIRALSKKLKTNCIVWGENEGDERQANIDAFQADEQRIILVNIAAGGTGVSLHDLNGNHPRVALISPNDSAPMLRQAFGRVHRAGALTKSQQRVIFIANTVEEDVCVNVKRKLVNLDRINDGDLNPDFEGMLRE